MKIAILGARGFVGRSLAGYLLHNNYVVPVTRDTVDLLDSGQVYDFCRENKFDVIVNAAATMTDPEGIHDTRNNLGMFMNFYNRHDLFGKFINLGSGAEFDRTMDISEVPENLIFRRMPKDSYGFGQNLKSRLCATRQNFYNLRLFNCFGKGELPTRIFPRILSGEKIEISNDRYFDYFGIDDLCKVVDSMIRTTPKVKDINCVYKDKFKISQVVDKFYYLNNLKPNFQIVSTSNNNYTGDGSALASLNLGLDGLEESLRKYVSN